jgi:hypothetical protein
MKNGFGLRADPFAQVNVSVRAQSVENVGIVKLIGTLLSMYFWVMLPRGASVVL